MLCASRDIWLFHIFQPLPNLIIPQNTNSMATYRIVHWLALGFATTHRTAVHFDTRTTARTQNTRASSNWKQKQFQTNHLVERSVQDKGLEAPCRKKKKTWKGRAHKCSTKSPIWLEALRFIDSAKSPSARRWGLGWVDRPGDVVSGGSRQRRKRRALPLK